MNSRQIPEVRWRVVAFVMDGTGAYLIATVFLIVAGMQFSHAFHEQDRIRTTFQELIFERAEPYRDEEYTVATAALVLQLDKDGHDVCKFASSKDDKLTSDLRLLQAFRVHLEAQLPSTMTQCPMSSTSTVDGGTPDAMPAFDAMPPPDAMPLPDAMPFDATLPADASAPSGAQMDAGVDAGAPLAAAMADLGDFRVRAGMGACTDQIHDTIAALQAGNWVADEPNPGDLLRLKLYFISSTGVSLLPSRTDKKVAPGHPLEGASYVRETLQGGARDCTVEGQTFQLTSTKPYRDISGDGIVQTICMPVGAPAAPIGVACMDRTTTMAGRLKRALERLERLFAVRSVIVDKASHTISRCETDCVAGEASPWLLAGLQHKLSAEKAWWPRADIVALKVSLTSKFSVLIIPATPSQSGSTTSQAIVLVPRDAEVIELPRLMLGLLMLVIASALVFRSTARQRERERLRTLHGLPTPVVVTRGTRRQPVRSWRHRLLGWVGRRLGFDLDLLPGNVPAPNAGEILFANAAAESLLGAKLPRFPRSSRIGFLTRGIESDTPRFFTEWLDANDRATYERESEKRHTFEASEYTVVLQLGPVRRRVLIKGEWLRRANGDMDSFGVIEVLPEADQ